MCNVIYLDNVIILGEFLVTVLKFAQRLSDKISYIVLRKTRYYGELNGFTRMTK